MLRVGIPLSIALSPLCGGCTIIHIEGAEGVTVSRSGILSIDARPGASMVAYRMTGFGLVPGQGGTTLGYRSEQVAIVHDPSDCRVVVFTLHNDQSSKLFWEKILAENANVCAVKGRVR